MKNGRYLCIFLTAILCWCSVIVANGAEAVVENPFQKAAQEELPLGLRSNPFEKELMACYDGHYIGTLVDLKIWTEEVGHSKGELRMFQNMYPLSAEVRGDVLCGTGEKDGQTFEFELEKGDDVFHFSLGPLYEELKKAIFPILIDSYEGERGTTVTIRERSVLRYVGMLEFRGEQMLFQGSVMGGTLFGTFAYEGIRTPFSIERTHKGLLFRTGKFEDLLPFNEEKGFRTRLDALNDAWQKGNLKEVLLQLTLLEEDDLTEEQQEEVKKTVSSIKKMDDLVEKQTESEKWSKDAGTQKSVNWEKALEKLETVAAKNPKTSSIDIKEIVEICKKMGKALKKLKDFLTPKEKKELLAVQEAMVKAAEAEDWDDVIAQATIIEGLNVEGDEARQIKEQAAEMKAEAEKRNDTIISSGLRTASKAIEKGDWQQAEKVADYLLLFFPNLEEAQEIERRARKNLDIVEQHLDAAAEALKNENWSLVRSEISIVLKINPNNTEAKAILDANDRYEEVKKIRLELDASAQDLEVYNLLKEAKNKCQAGYYEDSINLYKQAATEGNSTEAQYYLGFLYEGGQYKNGKINNPNYAEAEKWYLTAKNNENGLAKEQLDRLYEKLGSEKCVLPLSKNKSLEMVWVTPGTFTIGSPKDELFRDTDETQHTVTLTRGYWIGRYEVTQEQYRQIMKINPVATRIAVESDRGKGEQYPVYKVSWNDATNFCAKLTALLKENGTIPVGYKCSLPTEAQWEYACRGGTETSLNNGTNLRDIRKDRNLSKLGWYEENSGEKTHPVGKLQPNNLGIYDMHGNVWEYCLDWYDEYSDTVTDPIGPEKPPQKDYPPGRVIRGGSWNRDAGKCRSAYREELNPDSGHRTNDTYGFRIVLVPE